MLRSMDAKESRTPEGRLIAERREKSGWSWRQLAQEIGISDTQLRSWVYGKDQRGDVYFPASGLSFAALVVGISEDEMREARRTDAADLMAEARLLDASGELRTRPTLKLGRAKVDAAKPRLDYAQDSYREGYRAGFSDGIKQEQERRSFDSREQDVTWALGELRARAAELDAARSHRAQLDESATEDQLREADEQIDIAGYFYRRGAEELRRARRKLESASAAGELPDPEETDIPPIPPGARPVGSRGRPSRRGAPKAADSVLWQE